MGLGAPDCLPARHDDCGAGQPGGGPCEGERDAAARHQHAPGPLGGGAAGMMQQHAPGSAMAGGATAPLTAPAGGQEPLRLETPERGDDATEPDQGRPALGAPAGAPAPAGAAPGGGDAAPKRRPLTLRAAPPRAAGDADACRPGAPDQHGRAAAAPAAAPEQAHAAARARAGRGVRHTGPLYAGEVVGRRVAILRCSHAGARASWWDRAAIADFDAPSGRHKLTYAAEGRGEEWLSLADVKFKWEGGPGSGAAGAGGANPTHRPEMDGPAAVGRRLRLYWPAMQVGVRSRRARRARGALPAAFRLAAALHFWSGARQRPHGKAMPSPPAPPAPPNPTHPDQPVTPLLPTTPRCPCSAGTWAQSRATTRAAGATRSGTATAMRRR
jgi:hypothetical protein